MINKALISIIVLTALLSYSVSEAAFFTGVENNEEDIVDFFAEYIDDYFLDLSTLDDPEEVRAMIRLRKEMERLVLKIDAGDIKDEELRNKVIALRRLVMRKMNSGVFVINNFDRRNGNRLGGPVIAVYDGEPTYTSPWLAYALVNEEKRIGKKMLKAASP